MLKKVFTIILLFSSLFFYLKTYWATYEEIYTEEFGSSQEALRDTYGGNDSQVSNKIINDLKSDTKWKEFLINNFWTDSPTTEQIEKFQTDNWIWVDGMIWAETLTAMKNEQKKIEWKLDINTEYFMLNVNDFSPGWEWLIKNNAKATINTTLWTFIQKLMIALWSLALLIMTIWAWYMIIYNWQDEILSKWKSIFTSGIISLLVALTWYYIINLIRFLLYA